MTTPTLIAEHKIPTVEGELVLALYAGSTCYELTATDGRAPVTLYLSHQPTQHLIADLGRVRECMASRVFFTATFYTDAGVMYRHDPNGVIQTSMDLQPGAAAALHLRVDDMKGTAASWAFVTLDQAGLDALILAAATMLSHL